MVPPAETAPVLGGRRPARSTRPTRPSHERRQRRDRERPHPSCHRSPAPRNACDRRRRAGTVAQPRFSASSQLFRTCLRTRFATIAGTHVAGGGRAQPIRPSPEVCPRHVDRSGHRARGVAATSGPPAPPGSDRHATPHRGGGSWRPGCLVVDQSLVGVVGNRGGHHQAGAPRHQRHARHDRVGRGHGRRGQTNDLNFASAGTVTAVNVKAGDTVKAGQVLATIDGVALAAAVPRPRPTWTPPRPS